MPLDLGAPVMSGWIFVRMNLLRENSILLQCGRPPTVMNGVASGRENSGSILSELLRDTPPGGSRHGLFIAQRTVEGGSAPPYDLTGDNNF